ncbi:MAG: CDP-alcohol phosphatidyltransferase family protein [Pseudomonadota bacterium]
MSAAGEHATGAAMARRPIPSRSRGWARQLMRWLDGRGVTPNQVSAAGLGFGALAGVALWLAPGLTGVEAAALLITAATCIGWRLLANMADGMLAVEAGRATPDGPLWNELPDRLADTAVLAGLGAGIGEPVLGLLAALTALFGAQVRTLGEALGHPGDFGGPLAKPQRMGLVAAGALAAVALGAVWPLEATLWLVLTGTALTVCLRLARLQRRCLGAASDAR